MRDIMGMMGKVKEMQAKMEQMQAEIAELTAEAIAAEKTKALTAGLPIPPGFKLPF
jgi:DNA-binding protein YbaB